jgi:hypothetical protein
MSSSADEPAQPNCPDAPFVFIATNSVRDSMLAEERRRAPQWASFIRSHEPRLIAFHEYLNEDGTEVEFIQIHPDAASFEHHLDVIGSAQEPYQSTLEATTAIRIYGTPTKRILEILRTSVGSDVPITILPTHLGGFAANGSQHSTDS